MGGAGITSVRPSLPSRLCFRSLNAPVFVAPGGLAVSVCGDRSRKTPRTIAICRFPVRVRSGCTLDTPGGIAICRLAGAVYRICSLHPSRAIPIRRLAISVGCRRPLHSSRGVAISCLTVIVRRDRLTDAPLRIPIDRLGIRPSRENETERQNQQTTSHGVLLSLFIYHRSSITDFRRGCKAWSLEFTHFLTP